MFNVKKIAPRSSRENIVSNKKTQEKNAVTELLLRGIKTGFFPTNAIALRRHKFVCSWLD